MRKALGGWLLGIVMVVSVAGCTPQEGGEPVVGDIPGVPGQGAELVCGLDRTHLEAALGMAVGRVEDRLSVDGGAGSGQCKVWPENESLVSGPLLFVTFFAASSTQGLDARARVDGDRYRPPDVRYESVDGGVWGLDLKGESGHMTLGATSRVFWGETVVGLTPSRGAVGRDHVADLLALTRQAAVSYGLEVPEATP